MTYKLQLDVFEGPLDLLIYLIKRNDIDIYDIPIVTVTDQYLEYIEMMKMLDLEVIGEFLVMAATLLQIKSRMLLPQESEAQEEEDDPRQELVRRLQEYKIFKDAAEHLRTQEVYRQDYFVRRWDEEKQQELKDDAKEVYFDANLFDLINALTEALKRVETAPVYQVTQEEYTVEEKVHEILHHLLKEPKFSLNALFLRSRDKMEVIVTFMAILELIRLKEVRVLQKRLFSEVIVLRNTVHETSPATGGGESA